MGQRIKEGLQCLQSARSLSKPIVERATACIPHKRCTHKIIIIKYAKRSVFVALRQLHKILRGPKVRNHLCRGIGTYLEVKRKASLTPIGHNIEATLNMIAVLECPCIHDYAKTGAESQKGIFLYRHIGTVGINESLQQDAVL